MQSQTKNLLLAGLLALTVAVSTCCGVFNLGGTNEDGTPKSAADARLFLRSLSDAALQTWGMDALREHAPQVIPLFDADGNGMLTLAEIEGGVNLEDPVSTTALLVMAIELYRARPK
jgi:hypothetical protein